MSGIVGTIGSKSLIVDRPINAVKAWVNFEGDGTAGIRDAFNVTSIVSGGSVGRYNVTFDNAIKDNCSIVGGVCDDIDTYGGNRGICCANRNNGGGAKITTFHASSATEGDMEDISVIAIGD